MTLAPHANRQSPKCAQIILAARETFLTQGYGGASMDAIARHADVSKATLYAYFENKAELFLAVMEEEKRTVGLGCPVEQPNGEIRQVLRDFARQFLEWLTSQSLLALFRIVLAECVRFPELGRALFEAGPQRAWGRIAAVLEQGAAAGQLKLDDPARAAREFASLVKGELHIRCLLDPAYEPAPEVIGRQVDEAVDFFLRHYEG